MCRIRELGGQNNTRVYDPMTALPAPKESSPKIEELPSNNESKNEGGGGAAVVKKNNSSS